MASEGRDILSVSAGRKLDYEAIRVAAMRKYLQHLVRRRHAALRNVLCAFENAEELAMECGVLGRSWMEYMARFGVECRDRMARLDLLRERLDDPEYVPDAIDSLDLE